MEFLGMFKKINGRTVVDGLNIYEIETELKRKLEPAGNGIMKNNTLGKFLEEQQKLSKKDLTISFDKNAGENGKEKMKLTLGDNDTSISLTYDQEYNKVGKFITAEFSETVKKGEDVTTTINRYVNSFDVLQQGVPTNREIFINKGIANGVEFENEIESSFNDIINDYRVYKREGNNSSEEFYQIDRGTKEIVKKHCVVKDNNKTEIYSKGVFEKNKEIPTNFSGWNYVNEVINGAKFVEINYEEYQKMVNDVMKSRGIAISEEKEQGITR